MTGNRVLGFRPNRLRLAPPRVRMRGIAVAVTALGLALCPWLQQPANAAADAARALVTTPIDAARFVRLSGNTRPEATAAHDRGRVPDTLRMEHIQLLMKRPAEREAAVQKAIEEMHDRSSPSFHHWLNIAQIGERYG